ncbi:hypothetical protein [Pararcticibacter amylolyticus]|uniref:Uncharacterized protein n=1 Tax=Pararcticibacter amylolyticus TaxID=2173175 RepID=A0A2U2PGE0_9SPHI|nr:hypothetical protein [Pararcticibacter amylolyticus]PWG80394.1 hypothetical protein DDR33_12355 [Pararcticibacter amylolyticus]
MDTILLQGSVYWAYDYEIEDKEEWLKTIAGLFSFNPPLHKHQGVIALTPGAIEISGDHHLRVPLGSIEQIYLGFDSVFPASSVKNFGLFWKPLRITFSGGQVIYLIIDYTGIQTQNPLWATSISELLA